VRPAWVPARRAHTRSAGPVVAARGIALDGLYAGDLMSASDPLLGRVLAGRYRILRPLGAGGSGAVYEAEQLGLGRSVAVKVMRPELAGDAEHVERFRREALAAAQLRHPHIAQLLDFAHPTGSEPAFLVLELIEGRSLHQLLRAEAPLAPARAARLVTQILSALAAAHGAGIVHRDMKPGNVVVTDVPGVGEIAKVLDFGIARVQESEAYQRLTRTGVIMGTPRYMSPEQASGGVVDQRTDLWSVGVILYAALAGRFPFEGAPTEALYAIMTEDPRPLATPGLPAALEGVVATALQKNVADRYPSAAAMIDALRVALEPEVAVAFRPSAVSVSPAEPVRTSHEPLAIREPLAHHEPQARHAPVEPTVVVSRSRARSRVMMSVAVLLALALSALVALVGVGSFAWWRWGPTTWSAAGVPGLPAPPMPVLPGLSMPPVGAAGGSAAPTAGTSGVFLADATMRMAELEPSARLAMIAITGLSGATGEADVTQGDSLGYFFITGDGRILAVSYASSTSTYPWIAPAPTTATAFVHTPPDTGTVVTAALRACPALAQSEQVMFTATGMNVTLAVLSGPSWLGSHSPDGTISTFAAISCGAPR